MTSEHKKYSSVLAVIFLMFLVIFTGSQSTLAQSAESLDDLRSKIEQKNNEIEQLEKEIKLYQKQISETGKQADSLKAVIKKLELTKAKLVTDIKVTEKKIGSISLNIQKLDTQIKVKKSKIDENLDALTSAIKTANELDNESPIETLFSNNSFFDAWDHMENLQKYQGAINNKLDELSNLKKDLEVDKTETEKQKRSLLALKGQLSDQKTIVEVNKKEQDKVLTETKSKESNYKKILADRMAKKERLEREVLDFESKLKADVDISKLPKTGKGVLAWPLSTVKITQYFGNTPFATANSQIYSGMGHNGIDLGATTGTPLKSAADGIVVDTGDTDTACYGVSYGKWVLIKHNNGLSTLYAHLSLIKAYAGQPVNTGDTIGYSGNTGYSTGPHLHFAVYASSAVKVSGPTEYKSKVCGTYMKLPVAPKNGYLNPLSYL